MSLGARVVVGMLLLTPVSGLAGWRHRPAAVDACPVATEYAEIPACAVYQYKGRNYVRADWTKDAWRGHEVKVGLRILAWARVRGLGWVYLDRTGRVVIDGVAPLDNGPSPFQSGLVRVARQGKWALVNAKGKTVTRVEYDGMLDFNRDRWLACTGCVSRKVGESQVFDGGHWVALNKSGRKYRGLEGSFADVVR
jgi:hypothetical protein